MWRDIPALVNGTYSHVTFLPIHIEKNIRKKLSEKHTVITVYSCLNNLISTSGSLYIHVALETVKVMKCKSSLMDLIRVHAAWIMKLGWFQYILYRLTSKKPTEAVRRSQTALVPCLRVIRRWDSARCVVICAIAHSHTYQTSSL